MIVYALLPDGGFVAGDQASRVTAYAYPTSPHASRAKHGRAESTAKRMIERERAYKFRGTPLIVAQYDARNWETLASVALDQISVTP